MKERKSWYGYTQSHCLTLDSPFHQKAGIQRISLKVKAHLWLQLIQCYTLHFSKKMCLCFTQENAAYREWTLKAPGSEATRGGFYCEPWHLANCFSAKHHVKNTMLLCLASWSRDCWVAGMLLFECMIHNSRTLAFLEVYIWCFAVFFLTIGIKGWPSRLVLVTRWHLLQYCKEKMWFWVKVGQTLVTLVAFLIKII